jgi:hypothetical protein
MFVGLISSTNAIRDYHGYVDKEASSRKIFHNVFKMGDRAFLSGKYQMTIVGKLSSHQWIQTSAEKFVMYFYLCYMLVLGNVRCSTWFSVCSSQSVFIT